VDPRRLEHLLGSPLLSLTDARIIIWAVSYCPFFLVLTAALHLVPRLRGFVFFHFLYFNSVPLLGIFVAKIRVGVVSRLSL